ncbi:hypothetical protein [Alkalihalobacillus sp. AL-G]|uniref:hypothetical protein n=1 Tax=Alkalihalobacillus sp. AL-G TaxID=2926399 RepID=UPI00272AE245|nr:hypothetical protein [Alkalihalobacillus sp. AL-G]WLD93719.1 hypothetical protein MOJ78_02015 [Alkalihalobacillus sp. AL-G]
MASTKLVYLRTLIGIPLTELVICAEDLLLTNVIITAVGRDWVEVRQGGSGGIGTVWIPTRNIGGVII